VRILLALRRECPTADLPSMAPDGDNGTNRANADEVLQTEIPCQNLRSGARAKELKMKERSLNVAENKGSVWKTPERSWNVDENKGSYPTEGGMLLKRQVVTAQHEKGAGAEQKQFVTLARPYLTSTGPRIR
jgi:hypothetical protein